jgi:hypothetical protein
MSLIEDTEGLENRNWERRDSPNTLLLSTNSSLLAICASREVERRR